MCALCVTCACLLYVLCGDQSNQLKLETQVKCNRNRIMTNCNVRIGWNIDDCMLDIVVGTESNLNRKLYRTCIVFNRNRNIENRRTEPSNQAVDRSGYQPIEQPSRSNRLFDRAGCPIGEAWPIGQPFPLLEPINRAVIVILSTFGNSLTDQLVLLTFSQISSNFGKFSS